MSVKVSSLVWESEAVSDHSELLLLLALADWSNDDGESWHSVRKLASKIRRSDRHVQVLIRRLDEKGILFVEKNSGGQWANTNIYKINSKALAATGAPHAPVNGCTTCTGEHGAPVNHTTERVKNRAPTGEPATSPNTSVQTLLKRKYPLKPPKSGGGEDVGVVLELLRLNLSQLFSRELDIPWPNDDEHFLFDVSRRPRAMEEFEKIHALFELCDRARLPLSIRSLLLKWQETFERAQHPERERAKGRTSPHKVKPYSPNI